MHKLQFRKGVPIEGVAIEIQGEPHLLRFGNLALSSLEEQLDLDAPEALSRVARLLSTGRINTRLTLALVAAGLAHEAVAEDLDLPTWKDLAPSFEDAAGRQAMIALIPKISEAIHLAYPKPKPPEDAPPNPPAEPAGE